MLQKYQAIIPGSFRKNGIYFVLYKNSKHFVVSWFLFLKCSSIHPSNVITISRAYLIHQMTKILICFISFSLLSFKDVPGLCFTFSWISCVDWASQKATVATSFRMGISTVQSRPSSSATKGRGCMGPFIMGGLMPDHEKKERISQKSKMKEVQVKFYFVDLASFLTLFFLSRKHVLVFGRKLSNLS